MNYLAARRQMVDNQIRPNDVTDLAILKAFDETPREAFVPAEYRDRAYSESEVVYAPERRLLRARDFSKLLSIAEIAPNDIVMVLPCGSGYEAALIAMLCEMVVAIDDQEELAKAAECQLQELGRANTAVLTGALSEGAKKQGPFDVIVIPRVIEKRPDALLQQLKPGGRLATIFRENGVSRGGVFVRTDEATSFAPRYDAASTATLEGFEAEKTFVF